MQWLRLNWSNSLCLLRRFTGIQWCDVACFVCALLLSSSQVGFCSCRRVFYLCFLMCRKLNLHGDKFRDVCSWDDLAVSPGRAAMGAPFSRLQALSQGELRLAWKLLWWFYGCVSCPSRIPLVLSRLQLCEATLGCAHTGAAILPGNHIHKARFSNLSLLFLLIYPAHKSWSTCSPHLCAYSNLQLFPSWPVSHFLLPRICTACFLERWTWMSLSWPI